MRTDKRTRHGQYEDLSNYKSLRVMMMITMMMFMLVTRRPTVDRLLADAMCSRHSVRHTHTHTHTHSSQALELFQQAVSPGDGETICPPTGDGHFGLFPFP